MKQIKQVLSSIAKVKEESVQECCLQHMKKNGYFTINTKVFNLIALSYQDKVDLRRAKKNCLIQYGCRKHNSCMSVVPNISHGNRKNEIRQREEDEQKRMNTKKVMCT